MPTQPGEGPRGSEERQGHRLAGMLLAACLVLFYRDVVFGGRTFFMLDLAPGTMSGLGAYGYPGTGEHRQSVTDCGALAWAIEPAVFFTRRSLLSGELPLWDPNVLLGVPHLGAGQSGVLDPLLFPSYLCPRSWYPLVSDLQVLLRFWLAGFFTYLFCRRLGIGWWAAVFGGLTFLHFEYGFTYGNHASFRVFSLMPLVLYTLESSLQERAYRWVLAAIAALCWCLLADFPEASFLVLLLGAAWYVFRSASSERPGWLWLRLGLMFGAALALASPLIVELLANIGASAHMHSPGLGLESHDRSWMIFSLIPTYSVAARPFWVSSLHVTSCVLAMVGALSGWRLGRGKGATGFWLVTLVLCFGKQYGFPWAQWLGTLPGLSQILLQRDLSAPLEMAQAVLASLGSEALLSGRASSRTALLGGLGLTGLLAYFLGASGMSAWGGREALLPALAACLVFTSLPAALVMALGGPRRGAWLGAGLALALVCEVNYAHRGHERSLRYDPYTEAPYVSFLEGQPRPHRVFGFDGWLHPNIASAYGIDDVRFLLGLVPERAWRFVSELITSTPDILRLTGSESKLLLARPFDLLGIDYLLAPPHYERDRFDTRDLSLALDQGLPASTPACAEAQTVDLEGRKRRVISMRLPCRAALRVEVPEQGEEATALLAARWDPAGGNEPARTTAACVALVGEQDGTAGRRQPLVPRGASPGEDWPRYGVDLSPWRGRDVELALSCEPGAERAASIRWALDGVRFQERRNAFSRGSRRFALVYDAEIKIFRNNNAYPRAFVVHRAEAVSGQEEALRELVRPGFNPAERALLEAPRDALAGELLRPGPGPPPSAADVVVRGNNRLAVATTLEQPGVLVVSDMYYPGWRAYVDGDEAPIYAAFGVMRGVPIAAGHHRVEFIYFPLRLKLALGASALTAVALLGWGRLRRRYPNARAAVVGHEEPAGAHLGAGPARSWLAAIFVLTFAFYLAWLPRVLSYSSPPTGDQPFYLMDMASLAQDRDLNVKNNYDDADYDKFYAQAPHASGFVGMSAPYPLPRQLAPDTVRPASEQYSHHLPGLALLLLPAWKIGSWLQLWWPATMVAMCAIGALVGLNVFLLAYQATGRAWIALFTWLAVSFSGPLMTHSYLIFTELPVGLLLVYSFRRLSLGLDRNEWDRLLLVGLCIGFIPWLAWRCVLVTVTLTAYGLAQWWRAPAGRRRIAWLGCFLLPVLVSAASLIAFHFFLYGRLYPAAKVPELAGSSPFHWPWGGWDELSRFVGGALALLLDRDFGLLPWAPVYALAVPGALVALRPGRQEARRLLLAASLVVLPYVATLAAFEFWHGIWCPPARYLASIVPLLAAPLALALSPGRKGWRSWASPAAFAVLSLAGFYLMGLVLRDPHFLWPGGDRDALPWREWIPSFLRPDEVRQPLVLGAWLAAVLLLAALSSGRAALTGLLVAAAASWWLASHEYLKHKTVLTEERRWSVGLPLHDPHGIAYADGKVYVACYGERSASGDAARGEVLEEDLGSGETRRLRPRQDGEEAAWSHPGDVKLGRDGLLFVLNNGPGDRALLALRNGTEVVRRSPLPATSAGARGLELGPDGTVYVADVPGGQIVAYRVDGNDRVVGSRPVAGGLMNPSAMTLDQRGRLYVAQTYGWVQQLAADGTPLARLAKCSANSFAASSSEAGWIEVGCDDSVFSIEAGAPSVQMARVAPGGRPIQARISGMTYGPDGTLYVLEGDTLVSYRVRH